MSSDRWSICPKCQEVAAQKAERLQRDIESAKEAGDFSLFETLLTQSLKPGQPQAETLQQDWEIGIVNRGWRGFEVYFEASCAVCGFKYSFKATDTDLSRTFTFFGRNGEEWTRQL